MDSLDLYIAEVSAVSQLAGIVTDRKFKERVRRWGRKSAWFWYSDYSTIEILRFIKEKKWAKHFRRLMMLVVVFESSLLTCSHSYPKVTMLLISLELARMYSLGLEIVYTCSRRDSGVLLGRSSFLLYQEYWNGGRYSCIAYYNTAYVAIVAKI